MLERLIQSSRYLTVVTILLCLMAALALCVAAAMLFATIVFDSIQQRDHAVIGMQVNPAV